MNTTRLNAFMLITTRISEDGLTYLCMKLNSVKIGNLAHLSLVTKKVAND